MRSIPETPRVLRICRAEFCRGKGSEGLVEYAELRLGIKMGETTADNRFTLQAAYCLGYCGKAPAVMLDDQVCVRASNEGLDSLIHSARLGGR